MTEVKVETEPGYVFVVHGRIENLDVDAVVVPTDAAFRVERHWNVLWPGDPGVRRRRPPDWGIGSTAKVSRRESPDPAADLWFIDAAKHPGETPKQVVNKIVRGVEAIIMANSGVAAAHRRTRPLVAIPTLGVGLGGLGDIRGLLIKRLLARARASARRHRVDVVIVAFEASDFAAFQQVRRDEPCWLPTKLDESAKELGRSARQGDLALFVGAGVSMSSGLPSWGELTERLMGKSPGGLLAPGHSLNALDVAELISQEDDKFRKHVVDELTTAAKPGLAHLLLAGLACEEVVTTNFDLLYEQAAGTGGDVGSVAVLPWNAITERGPWLLKMHGDIKHPKTIVLSRGDFVRYDSANGPAGAVVQALMMSRHLLVVGASLTDDNFLRLAHEVQDFLKAHTNTTRMLGTVLSLGAEPARQRLFAKSFGYLDTSQGVDEEERPRNLCIFLDAVGMYATADAPFLLDPRYRDLMDEGEVGVAEQIQGLTGGIQDLAQANPGGPWASLWQSLRDFGAR